MQGAAEDAEVDVSLGVFLYSDGDDQINQKTVFDSFIRDLMWLLSKFVPGQRSEVWRILNFSQWNSVSNCLKFYGVCEKLSSRRFLFQVKLPGRYILFSQNLYTHLRLLVC